MLKYLLLLVTAVCAKEAAKKKEVLVEAWPKCVQGPVPTKEKYQEA